MNLAYSSDYLLHETGTAHPEKKERLIKTIDKFDEIDLWEYIEEIDPTLVNESVLELIHSKGYIEKVKSFSEEGGGKLDPDTVVGKKSLISAKKAVGAGIDLLEEVKETKENGFGLVRPPGHHAERDKAMGFCLFNNVAITAEKATREGMDVAVVDWDVHHGNGTQSAFYERSDVLYFSIHQKPHYPGTGKLSELGKGMGVDYNINVPLSSGKTDVDYLFVFEEIILPILKEYGPDVVFVSAGFDAHKKDNLSGMKLSNRAFEEMAEKLNTLNKPIIALLEGGYNLDTLPISILATLKGLGTKINNLEDFGEPREDLSQEVKEKVNKIKETTERWF